MTNPTNDKLPYTSLSMPCKECPSAAAAAAPAEEQEQPAEPEPEVTMPEITMPIRTNNPTNDNELHSSSAAAAPAVEQPAEPEVKPEVMPTEVSMPIEVITKEAHEQELASLRADLEAEALFWKTKCQATDEQWNKTRSKLRDMYCRHYGFDIIHKQEAHKHSTQAHTQQQQHQAGGMANHHNANNKPIAVCVSVCSQSPSTAAQQPQLVSVNKVAEQEGKGKEPTRRDQILRRWLQKEKEDKVRLQQIQLAHTRTLSGTTMIVVSPTNSTTTQQVVEE
jgi:hypothetical protein